MTAANGAEGTVPEPLERISFGFHKQGLVGAGLGPVGTSLPDSGQGYQRLATWRDRLGWAVAPELPPEHTAPSYWYRRFKDGQGALLRRLPGPAPSDRRDSTAQALVGKALNAPLAILVALRTWPKVHEWLSAPQDTDHGWARMTPRSLRQPNGLQRLEREAATQEELVPLVARLLNAPFSPVDVPVPEGVPSLNERGRLLLLWGAYRTLMDVLGTERDPRGKSADWSFSTYEPWPESERSIAAQSRPRIAFRPPGPVSGAAFPLDVLGGESGSPHTETARWLIGHLGAGTLTGITETLSKAGAADHAEVLEHLHLRMRGERRQASRTVPVTDADRRRPPVFGPEAVGDRWGEESRAQHAAHAAADRSAWEDRVQEGPEQTGPTPEQEAWEPPRGGHQRPGPGERREPGDALGWRQPNDHPERWERSGLTPVPVQGHPIPAPPPSGHVDEELQRLLDQLRQAKGPKQISAWATRIVEYHHPGFSRGRRLEVRGWTTDSWEVHPGLLVALAALNVLLLVLLILMALL